MKMPMFTAKLNSTNSAAEIFVRSDISPDFLEEARTSQRVAVDVETSGLEWRTEEIGSCQLYAGGGRVEIVRTIEKVAPQNLALLLRDESVQKISHHAMFDMRFLAYCWGAKPVNVACTKIASKILNPEGGWDHSLKGLLENRLNIQISKQHQASNWLARTLSRKQLTYAASDVLHLSALLDSLESELAQKDLIGLAYECFDHIPTRVQLDLFGYPDVYQY